MMILRSPSFADGQEIPRKHGKRGNNVSPGLSWDDPPPGTMSYALAMVDVHPTARGYVHWLVVDISAETIMLPEDSAGGAMPKGSYEASPYAGPSPPSGTHDYEITLYALDTDRIDLPRNASLDQFLAAVEPHTLATARLAGAYTT